MAGATDDHLETLMHAEFGVRQLHARCVDAVWRKDAAGFAALFLPEGTWKVAGMTVTGRAAIAQAFNELTAVNQRILMRFGTPSVAFAGKTITARTYTVEYVKRNDGTGMNSIGIYFERFGQLDGEWLFDSRHFDFCYFGPPDLSADLFPFVDRGPIPAMPASDSPTAGM